ncbi:integrase core domain-containing protein [Sphingomonas sp. BGYR3]|uniref:transposase n=1 Tax=Sphingomonas sp. BGYR3 TaxID=2975483 RepID=UPI0021A794EA|nr:transposase [Sphingomonas sp. BGYR3]MDG5487808.1 integrase core domain-containing protein [Sphingomonas sp. BGYR3]
MVTPGAKQDAVAHALFVLAAWRHDYNTVRPHSKLGGKTPTEIAGHMSGGTPPATLASHQTIIIQERDPPLTGNNQGSTSRSLSIASISPPKASHGGPI